MSGPLLLVSGSVLQKSTYLPAHEPVVAALGWHDWLQTDIKTSSHDQIDFFWFFFWVVTLVVSSSQHVLFKERNKAIFCARPKKKKKTKNQISLPAFTGTDVTRSCQAHDHADWPITLSSINLSITHYPSSHLPLEILSPCLCRSCCD